LANAVAAREQALQQLTASLEQQVEARTAELCREAEERARLQARIIAAQNAALAELATPLVPISDDGLPMPLIGALDDQRVVHILSTLLHGVERARVAILDIPGVPVVDTHVARVLIDAAPSSRLLGARAVLTGIRPEVAQALIGLGVDLGGLVTRSTLQSGIAFALGRCEGPFSGDASSSRRPAIFPTLCYNPSGGARAALPSNRAHIHRPPDTRRPPATMRDVIVIGAGPAGATVARELAAAGLDVLLLDRAVFPRDKTCGDGLTPRALHLLARSGVLSAVEGGRAQIRRVALTAPDGTPLRIDMPAIPGWPDRLLIVPRLELDALLCERACAAGATLLAPVRARLLRRLPTHVEVEADRDGRAETFLARLAVVATGASHGLLLDSGLLAWPPRVVLAARAYVEDAAGLDAEMVHLRFDGVPLPGYAWIFPLSATSANIGLGYTARGPGLRRFGRRPTPRAALDAYFARPAMREVLAGARRSGPVKGFPIRADFLHSPTVFDRVLLAGEAAGLVNPMTGDGIDFALESGMLAAGRIAACFAAGDFSRAALAPYDTALRARFTALFRLCGLLQRTAVSSALALNLLTRAAARRPDLKDGLVRRVLGPPAAAIG
jgi:geranylgeranyl reductase family protein